MNKRTDGAVTVFLSCILLIVIVFTCTVIDSTRIRVARLQSLRALRNATSSILANYDSQISDEYGMFMLEKEDYTSKIEEYAGASLEPDEDLPEMNRIYKKLYPNGDNKEFNLYDYNLTVTGVMPINNIVSKDTDYIKLQILEYMKYRAPLLAIEPILDKFKLITKSSKTTNYVKKKMEITNKASKIDDEYRELERLIDGINISKKGNINYEDFYVKGIISQKGISRNMCFKEIPNVAIRSRLQGTIYDIYDDINQLRDNMDYFNNCKTSMIETYKQLYYIRQEISELSNDDLSDDEDQMEYLSECIETSNELNESFINQLDIARGYKESIERCISNISNLSAYLTSNQSAVQVIEKIQKQGNKLKESIEQLEKDMKTEKDNIIEQTSNAIEDELKDLKGKLAIEDNEDKTYTLVNNLIAIKDELENNIKVLSDNITYVNELKSMKNNLVNHMIDGGFTPEESDILYSFINEIETSDIFKEQNSYTNSYNDKSYTQDFKRLLYQLENGLNNNYSTQNMIFNYGDMESLSDSEKDKKDPRDEVTDATKDIEFNQEQQNISDKIDENNMPSILSSNSDYIDLINNQDVDFYDEGNFTSKSLNIFGDIAKRLESITYNLRDEIYIGEYILGNFKSATDNLPDASPLTLSNYSKDDHYLNNEVEYILRGSLDENINLKHVSSTILGIRFVMNYMHILTNANKRTLVMSIATSIAGWWTFGLGTYIVAALIMAAWSYAESCVDVKYLLQGEKVGFIKTSGDWYTSLEGIANGIIDEATDYVTDKSVEIIDTAKETVENNISIITKRLEDDVSEYAKDKLGQVLDETKRSLS
jgi:hypothetical protein